RNEKQIKKSLEVVINHPKVKEQIKNTLRLYLASVNGDTEEIKRLMRGGADTYGYGGNYIIEDVKDEDSLTALYTFDANLVQTIRIAAKRNYSTLLQTIMVNTDLEFTRRDILAIFPQHA